MFITNRWFNQWGNIINGVELIRRMLKKESFGLTTPLTTLASEQKWVSQKKSYLVK